MPGYADLFEDDKLFNKSIAADPDPLASLLTDQWKQLAQLHALMKTQLEQTEREMATFPVKTPYVLLLSVTGISVVSAGELAGEAGPIEHYASATALNGRSGLYPSRYQSDEVDRNSGVIRRCRAAARTAQPD